MIKVEGYKAFHGVMLITPKSKNDPVLKIEGDWLYKPHHKRWYRNEFSYPAEVCTIVSDNSEKQIPKKTIIKASNGYLNICCPACEKPIAFVGKYCYECGQNLGGGE